jgi:hypothetical protein
MKNNYNAHFYQQDHVQSLQPNIQHQLSKSPGGHEKLFSSKPRKQSGRLGDVHAFYNNLGIWLLRGTISPAYSPDTQSFLPGVY